MSEPEQCIICLEPLPHLQLKPSDSPTLLDGTHQGALPQPTTLESTEDAPTTTITAPSSINVEQDSNYHNIIAVLDGCEHIIHDKCIRSWAEKTNSCPICRKIFHTVSVFNGIDGEYHTYFPSFPCLLPFRSTEVANRLNPRM